MATQTAFERGGEGGNKLIIYIYHYGGTVVHNRITVVEEWER